MANKIRMPEIKAKVLKIEEPGGQLFDVVAAVKTAMSNIASILNRLDAIEKEVFPEPETEPDPEDGGR